MQKWVGPGLGLVVWFGLKAAGVNSIVAFIIGAIVGSMFGPGLAWILSGMPGHYRKKMHGKAICIRDAMVYTEMDSLSPPLAKLVPGSEVEPVEAIEKNDVLWVIIKLPDGQQGYILERNIKQ